MDALKVREVCSPPKHLSETFFIEKGIRDIELESSFWSVFHESDQSMIPSFFEAFRADLELDSYVLDFGFGAGRTLTEWHELGYKNVFGVEACFDCISWAKNKFGKNVFHYADSELFDYFGRFSVIYMAGVLSAIEDELEIAYISEIVQNLLSEDGTLFIYDYGFDKTQTYEMIQSPLVGKVATVRPSWSKYRFSHYTAENMECMFSRLKIHASNKEIIPSFNHRKKPGIKITMKGSIS